MTLETLHLASSVSGNVVTPAAALGAPDGSWTGNTGNTDWTHRWRFDALPSEPFKLNDDLSFGLLHRRTTNWMASSPYIGAVRFYQGATQIASFTNNTYPSDSGIWWFHEIPAASLINSDPIDVQIDAHGAGSSWGARTIQINAASLEIDFTLILGTELKLWNGTGWDTGRLRRWNGDAWEFRVVKMWTGSAWEER